mmetsp:Transcript_65825/g.122796  ORF Transcript_65825/g.122796 Transcript_65825/m.122796 type:complete len:618 (+) Transcript_65825:58-1911(+)
MLSQGRTIPVPEVLPPLQLSHIVAPQIAPSQALAAEATGEPGEHSSCPRLASFGAVMLAGGACALRRAALSRRWAPCRQVAKRSRCILSRRATLVQTEFMDMDMDMDFDDDEPPRFEGPPRVRFAPSPTGVLHVGGARTALFNWLYAKSLGGQMVLRIEDTDTARSTAESEEAILEDLKWCGLTWDEGPDIGGGNGPYRQSERLEAGIYQGYLEQLMEKGHVYRCFLKPEELDAMREEAERNEMVFILESPWAGASEEEVQEMLDKDEPFVYRFRIPSDRDVTIFDEVLGEVTWNSDDLGGDFVIVRQNGMPTYNFSVVIDDASMDITHVLRAQEHLMNTPRQILIYEALGFRVPRFGHMPLILAPDRSKLSKRHGAASVGDYKKLGYLPVGLVNYLAQLGWNDGTNKEIYTIKELVECFTMDRMSKVSAVFDVDKCRWVNANHLRSLSEEQVVQMIGEELEAQGVVSQKATPFVENAASMLKERISTLSEAAEELTKHMGYPLEEMLASKTGEKYAEDIRDTAKALLSDEVRSQLPQLGEDPKVLKSVAKAVAEARGGVKGKKLQLPLRLCLTASDAGPNLTLLFSVLGNADDTVLCECVPLDVRLEKLTKLLSEA